jgi:hypothetical protein
VTEDNGEWLDAISLKLDPHDPESTEMVYTPKETTERIEKFVDEYNFNSRSSAMRHLLGIGLRAAVMNDPRTSVSADAQDEDEISESVKLKDFVPSGRENAVDVRSELMGKIDKELLEAVQRDPDIEMDGWEVYCNEG